MPTSSSRRRFLKTSATATATAAASRLAKGAPATSPIRCPDLYPPWYPPAHQRVGVVTHLGGSLMPPEVVEAMDQAARHFVSLTELQQKVGARIAELLGAPAAMVTCGCASAITLGMAACVAMGDPEKLRRLPDTTG